MTDLLLSILFATSLFVVFSIQKKFGLTPLLTIIINYFTAAILGFLILSGPVSFNLVTSSNWFPLALIMGSCFVGSFTLMGKTTQSLGVNVAAVASKMSMVIPVLFAIVYFKEKTEPLKVLAILIAFIAVYLSSVKDEKGEKTGSMLLPILLFLGCGLVDLLINFSQKLYGGQDSFRLMPATLFLIAGLVGALYLLVFNRKLLGTLSILTLVFGVILGVCNYLSLHYLYRALRFGSFPSSALFPLNNVGVVALSAVIGIIFFKEKISKTNSIGLVAALVALVLLIW